MWISFATLWQIYVSHLQVIKIIKVQGQSRQVAVMINIDISIEQRFMTLNMTDFFCHSLQPTKTQIILFLKFCSDSLITNK